LFRLFLQIEAPTKPEMTVSQSEINIPMFIQGKLDVQINLS